jgi:hypothetical protein
MLDGIQIIQRVAARGALVKVLDKPYLDLTSTMGQGKRAFLRRLLRMSASGSSNGRRMAGRLPRRAAFSLAANPS